jgi:hypothetical protein
MSLKLALERLLGAPCYHMIEVFQKNHYQSWIDAAAGRYDWDRMFDGYAAAVDWPAAGWWKEISAKYPDAIILHSTRESSEAWWKSANATIFNPLRQRPPGPMGDMMGAMLTARFTPDIHDKAAAIAKYESNNAEVLATAPKGRLVQWKPGDGWAPLCAALKLPVPSEPFPHVNTTDEFNERISKGQVPGMKPPER